MQGGPGLGASLRGPCELAPQDGPPRALIGAPGVPSFLRPGSSEPRAGGWGRGSFQAPCRCLTEPDLAALLLACVLS